MKPPVCVTEDRRESGRQTCEKLEQMEDRLARGDARMDRIEEALETQRVQTETHMAATAEVLTLMKTSKTIISFGDTLGGIIVRLSVIGAAIGALWLMLRGKP